MLRRAPDPGTDPARRAVLTLALGLAATLPGRAADAGTGTHEWRPWPPGRAVPPLNLTALDGSPWRLADQRGKLLLVNFWATWCEPCRAEIPSLLRLAARHAAAGVAVVTVNYRETPAAIRRFLDAAALAMPVLLDSAGQATVAWTPLVFPTTVFVGRSGRPAGTLVGDIDWDGAAAQALLAPLLTKA